MIIDFSTLTIGTTYAGTLTFLDETAGFRNAFGMYKIDDDGNIHDVDLIFANSSAAGSGGELIPGESVVDLTFTKDDKIGFFVAPNAYSHDRGTLLDDAGGRYVMRNAAGEIANIDKPGPVHLVHVAANGTKTIVPTQYGGVTWHSTAEADNGFALNTDKTDHTIWDLKVEGGTLVLDMRFEDLWGGGDMDYADIVFRLDVGPENTLDAVDSGKDPATALAASDRFVVPRGGAVIVDPLANDPGTGLAITHLDGRAVRPGDTITLADGETVTLLADGRIEIVGSDAPTDFDKLLTYAVADRTGATDGSVIALVTPAFAKDDAVMVTARGEATIDLFANDVIADGGSLTLTHFAGQAVTVGAVIKLGSGTTATYRGGGTFDFTGADIRADALDRISYTIVDENGLVDGAMLDVVTSPVDGTSGNDTYGHPGEGDAQGNVIGGDDGAAEVVMGYGGDDKIFAGDGDDALFGGDGHDNLRGEAGDDFLDGGDGNDLLSGGTGADTVLGGRGDDAYWVDDAADVIVEAANEGTDKVRSMVDWELGEHFEKLYLEDTKAGGSGVAGTGNALGNFIGGNDLGNRLEGLGGDDRITGMDGDDTLDGGDGRDDVTGGRGDDVLFGGDGADKLRGDDGDDRIGGNGGNDMLFGGRGADVFLFAPGDGQDIVYDFARGEDMIEMSGLAFDDLTLTKRGAGTQITYGEGDGIYVAKLGGEMLTEADFLFV